MITPTMAFATTLGQERPCLLRSRSADCDWPLGLASRGGPLKQPLLLGPAQGLIKCLG